MPTGSVTPGAVSPPFNGGTITQELVVDTAATTTQALELQGTRTSGLDVLRIDYPHTVLQVDSDGSLNFSSDDAAALALSGTGATAAATLSVVDARTNRANVALSSFSGISLEQHGTGNANIVISNANGDEVFGAGTGVGGGIRTSPQQSGALHTTTFVSGTGKQIDVFQDRNLVTPFTGDATNNAATLLIQLSPDDVTYSTLDTLSIAAALNLTGAINTPVSMYVPAGWYVKLTATHGTIGTATYY